MKHSVVLEHKRGASTRVACVFAGTPLKRVATSLGLASSDRPFLESAAKSFTGEYLACERFALPSDPTQSILLLGLGAKKEWTQRRLRIAARKTVMAAKASHTASFAVHLDEWKLPGLSLEKIAAEIAINTELAGYEFRRYKEKPKEGWPEVEGIEYVSSQTRQIASLKKAVEDGRVIGAYTNITRDLSNTPGGDMTPKILAGEALRLGKEAGVRVTVLDEKKMNDLKMGALLGVSKGSKEEAQLIVLEYRGAASVAGKPIVFLGKGITFDSGGLHLKPSSSMDEMHMDMSGGAAVIAAVCAIARLKLKVNCVGIIPAVENMPSGESYRPGDILTSMSGKTIEVVSPDAEGRVVLADALTYAKKYTPRLVVDVATLTGACAVALGHHAFALLTPQKKVEDMIRLSGEQSGDYVWPLPLWSEYEADIKGTVGDILNAGKNREAGTINGAQFLYQFAKDFPAWAHLDIASTMTTAQDQLLSRGASGTGTRLLIEIARRAI